MKLPSFWNTLAFHTKASLVFTILVFFSVPVTVLSVNAIRDSKIKAAGLGDPNYPDTVVPWTKTPHWQVQICNSGQAMDDRNQCQIADTDGYGQGSSQPQYTLYQGGTDRRFDSYVKLLVKDPTSPAQLKWVVYEKRSFQGACAVGALCTKVVTWSVPTIVFTAKYHAENKSACQDGPQTCQATANARLNSLGPEYAFGQFIDLPNSINLDVEISINNNLMDTIVGFASGSVVQISAPSLKYPQNNSTIAQSAFNGFRLQWATVPGASYYAVWVSTSDDYGKGGFWWKKVQSNECGDICSKGFVDGGWTTQAGSVSNPGSAPVNIEAGKKYYWMVSACAASACPGVSVRNIFTTEASSTTTPTPTPTTPQQTLGQPILITPLPNGSAPAENINPQPIFSWKKVTGAVNYGVAVSDDLNKLNTVTGVWRNLLKDSACSGTSCQIAWTDSNWASYCVTGCTFPKKPDVLSPNSFYYWYVWACSGNNSTDCPITSRTIGSFKIQAGQGGITPMPTDPTTPTPQPTPPADPKPIGTVTPNTPIVTSPSLANNGTLTPDIDVSPAFRWYTSANANAYIIAVSDSASKLTSLSGYWASAVNSTACTGQCSRNWSESSNWANVKDITPRSTNLNPGQVYYWSVRACNDSGCSLPSFSSFRTRGDVTEVGPKNLTATPLGGVGVYSFLWDQASSSKVVDYTIFLKQKNGDFLNGINKGDYWAKTKITCTSNPCKTDLTGSWTYYNNNIEPANTSTPPNPLPAGDWYFVVFACKVTNGCITQGLSSFLVSDISKFTVRAMTIKPPETGSGGDAASPQALITQETPNFGSCQNGRIGVTFSWTPASAKNVISQYIDLSLFDNNFLSGTFLGSNPPPPVGTTSYPWNGLLAGRVHFWRVNTNVGGQWYSSNIATFKTPKCPDLTASSTSSGGVSGSLGRDLEKSSDPTEVQNYLKSYIAGLQDNPVDPKRPNSNLTDIMMTVMGGESGGGQDCAYHIDTDSAGNPTQSTIGAFQFTPDLWQGSANHGLDDALDYTNSGSIIDQFGNKKTSGCWKTPGGDDVGTGGKEYWANAFLGAGYDAGAWDPYAQVRVATKYIIDGYGCRWSVYKLNYGGC